MPLTRPLCSDTCTNSVKISYILGTCHLSGHTCSFHRYLTSQLSWWEWSLCHRNIVILLCYLNEIGHQIHKILQHHLHSAYTHKSPKVNLLSLPLLTPTIWRWNAGEGVPVYHWLQLPWLYCFIELKILMVSWQFFQKKSARQILCIKHTDP